jgi:hypothetical protein
VSKKRREERRRGRGEWEESERRGEERIGKYEDRQEI